MVLEQLAEIGLEADISAGAGAPRFPARQSPQVPPMPARCAADAVVLALAADHVVRDPAAFVAACRPGPRPGPMPGRIRYLRRYAGEPVDRIWLHPAGRDDRRRSPQRCEVSSEKPDAATAAKYVAEGYLWNSGNFMFRAETLLGEYARFDAESVQTVTDAVTEAGRDLGFVTLDKVAFEKAKTISIDYAVMGKRPGRPQ